MTFRDKCRKSPANLVWRKWGFRVLSFVLVFYCLQQFVLFQTMATGLGLAAAALLSYLVLLLKLSDRQAGSALEAEYGEWR